MVQIAYVDTGYFILYLLFPVGQIIIADFGFIAVGERSARHRNRH
jgi:hypothetical protein